jgi:class 3 adenylate cyclase/alpha-beta hydrolase superfamily lysophospholipase
VIPETRFASADDLHIAYQVLGEGPIDVVFVPDWFNHVEAQWDEPASALFLRRLASFGRLVVFDKRGTGLSDPVPLSDLPTLEAWMDDLRIVLDAVGSESAALVCASGGAFLGLLFAATYPERVGALILIEGFARLGRADDYPPGAPPELIRLFSEWVDEVWGTGRSVDVTLPSRATDRAFCEWRARYERLAASPGTVTKMFDFAARFDVRQVLPTITAPTLVLHRAEDRVVPPAHGRYLAEHIAGASYVELPGSDYLWLGQDSHILLEEIQEFLTGVRTPSEPDRVLTTILFTDVVGSTELSASLGNERWREVLDRHDAVIRRQLVRARGREVNTTGDGFVASFDGPARAIRCAVDVTEAMRPLELEVRAGLHSGECEVRGGDLGGLAVHIAARVADAAQPGEVLVSSTVKDLVAGSGIGFSDRGLHRLKGVPDEWRLYAITTT